MRLIRLSLILMLCLGLSACESSEDRAQKAYARGLELLEAGDEDRARVEFRNAVRLDASLTDAQLQLGRINLKNGELRPAFRSYRIVVENEPDNIEALTALSRLSFLGNDWQAFERYSQEVIERAPELIETQVISLASRYRQAAIDQDFPLRASLLAEATEMHEDAPDDRLLRRLLIDGNLAEGRLETALEQIEKVLEDDPRARDFHQLKVQVLSELGDLSGVEDGLRHMITIFPADQELQGTLLRFLMGQGKAEEAEAFLRERVAEAAEDNNEPYLSLIQFLASQQGNDVAMEELERGIAAQPDSHALRALRATMAFDAGDRNRGITEMEALTRQEAGTESFSNEDLQRYKGILAKMLNQNGNEVGARRLVEEILNEDPNDGEALKMRARWLVLEDDTSGAINALRTALAENPRDAEAMTVMAQAYERAGDRTLMMDFLSLAVEASNNRPDETIRFANALIGNDRLDQAETALMGALRLQPSNVALLANLARVYLRQEDFSRAKQVARALRDIASPLAIDAADGIEVELIAREQGTEQALTFLGDLAQNRDGTASVKLTYIQSLLQSGDVERARQYADELLQEDPDNDGLVYLRALIQATSSNIDGARETLRSLTASTPEATAAWQLLARLHVAEGDEAGAVEVMDEALVHQPDAPDLLWAKASYLENLGDIDGTIAIYERLYELGSNSTVIANNLASVISSYKDDLESLERARIIARRLKNTDVPAFQDTYGWILHRTGSTEEALPYLEQAAEGLPEDVLTQVHLGRAYLALGRIDEAKTQLSRARAAAGPVDTRHLQEQIESFAQDISTR